MTFAPDSLQDYPWRDLPDEARALFGGCFFSEAAWYETVVASALPAAGEALFLVWHENSRPACVFPMLRTGRTLQALTTPYTVDWAPLTAPDLTEIALRKAGRAFARFSRRYGAVRLDCLDRADRRWDVLLGGMREGRMLPLLFSHFGNWSVRVSGQSWTEYLASRPGQLREAIRRRTRQIEKSGAEFRLVQNVEELDSAIAAYESVYARSWKEPEPYPHFIPTLMRVCAREGWLRLGLLQQGDRTMAAQFWVLREGWASVLKLAHDEEARALSPGTVLTAKIISTLMESERVDIIDFGRGDDPYKQDWTGERAQRSGVMLAFPIHRRGAAEIARWSAGRVRARISARALEV